MHSYPRDDPGARMTVPANQDLLVSIYNLHRSPANWGPTSQQFEPMRFGPLASGQPSEMNTDYRYVPFSAGPRRCPGDRFAILEGMAIWATMFRRLDSKLLRLESLEAAAKDDSQPGCGPQTGPHGACCVCCGAQAGALDPCKPPDERCTLFSLMGRTMHVS